MSKGWIILLVVLAAVVTLILIFVVEWRSLDSVSGTEPAAPAPAAAPAAGR